MKILVVHNAYRERGGEDAVVEAETALLRRCGHEVIEYRRDNHEIDGMASLAVAAQTLWSRRTLRELGTMLAQQRPDVVHLHNSFPLISPSVCAAAARAGVPLVQTLHNYRLACPQAMFLRDGRPCEDCLGRVPLEGVGKPAFRLDGGDLGAVLAFDAVLWNEPMTGVLREIHLTPGRVRVVVLQTEQQKGLYPRYTASGDPDAPYLADYDIDFGDEVWVSDHH